MKVNIFLYLFLLIPLTRLSAQNEPGKRFEQLGPLLSSPNQFRTAAGAPGKLYWQQKADYDISVELIDETQTIIGSEKITYTNNSPDVLTYLWLQLDQNAFSKESDFLLSETGSLPEITSKIKATPIVGTPANYGFTIKSVKEKGGNDLHHTIHKTMMRVELPKPLSSGEKFELHIDWSFNIPDLEQFQARGGKELFKEDGNYLYSIAQWFPRMCVYSDYGGWQNKQFLHQAEFSLPFGDYKVKITAPSDFMIAATGILQNPKEVLSKTELERWEKARKSYDNPVTIRTYEEVIQLEKTRSNQNKTWLFHASMVRDFAFAASRKLIWDAMAVKVSEKEVMAMSYYPKEARPIYEQFSTKAVAHTLKVYSKHTVDYPYPVAIAVEANNAIEYPMICFTYGRAQKDGKYSENLKYRTISVIFHEIGHNFFPMIINSDERQWAWLDEGINSFIQLLAEQEWETNYPSRRGTVASIIPHMKESKESQQPIMTGAENILKLSYTSYYKPSTALTILRETVMGKELFDYAFKEYARRWKFKHPTPEDFFRTMEDASAVDLDWFWRGWFYSTDHVDMSIESVKKYQYEEENSPLKTKMSGFSEADKKALYEGKYLYEITFKNKGGVVMPLILEFTFADGTKEIERIPAEVWRRNGSIITKIFAREKEVKSILFDPNRELADVDESNNLWKASQN